jgi:hypothetical protein
VATLPELRTYLGRLAVTLWDFGAEFPEPTLDPYDDGSYGFAFAASLPGPDVPRPAIIKLIETWVPTHGGEYRRAEYAYDFIEDPLNRRRAFHRHDEEEFMRDFAVAVDEHCEEVLGRPACRHYLGLPVDGDEAIRRFTVLWGEPGRLDCSRLRCIGDR